MSECIGCGNCCKKHWLVKLTNKHELELFEGSVVFGDYIWTDECKYQIDNKCSIHENKPYRCKEFECEGQPIVLTNLIPIK